MLQGFQRFLNVFVTQAFYLNTLPLGVHRGGYDPFTLPLLFFKFVTDSFNWDGTFFDIVIEMRVKGQSRWVSKMTTPWPNDPISQALFFRITSKFIKCWSWVVSSSIFSICTPDLLGQMITFDNHIFQMGCSTTNYCWCLTFCTTWDVWNSRL